MVFSLLNPLTVATAVIYGQADALVAVGLVTAIIGWQTERWWLSGVGLAFGTVIKIYPIILFVPLIFRQRDHIREIVLGALPILTFVSGATTGELPHSAAAFINPDHPFGFQAVSPGQKSIQYVLALIFDTRTVYSVPIFEISLIVSVIWASVGRFEDEIVSLIVPLFPIVYIYDYSPTYRWLPFILVVGYIGYADMTDKSRTFVIYAWGFAVVASIWSWFLFGTQVFVDIGFIQSSIESVRLTLAMYSNIPEPVEQLQALVFQAAAVSNFVVMIWAWSNILDISERRRQLF